MKPMLKQRRFFIPVAIGLLIVFEQLILGYVNPPTCTPSCSSWTCVGGVGSVSNAGSLTMTNATICVGSTLSVPSLTNTTFINGQKVQTCTRSDCSTYQNYASITYTATNWWVPQIPAVFLSAGTFIFTNEVEGISKDSDCPGTTAPVISGTLTVTVNSLVITTQPTNQVVTVGSNATFSVVAIDCSPLNYQWWFRGGNLMAPIAGATNTTLVVTNAQLTNAGSYWAVVTSTGEILNSAVASLTVVGVNRIIVDGAIPEIAGATSIATNTTIALRVIADPPGIIFPANTPVWNQLSGPGLTLPSAGTNRGSFTPTTGGQYVISASCGNSSNIFTLTVVDGRDTNYNGIPDSTELLYAPETWHTELGSWRFDTPDWAGIKITPEVGPAVPQEWIGVQGQLPISYTNILLVSGWSVGALEVNSNNGPAWLLYPEINTNSSIANINCREGSIRFWFRPDWSSANQGGTGPQTEARLVEMGQKGTANGCFGLYIGPTGTNLYFCTQTNSAGSLPVTNLAAAIGWIAGIASTNWHHLTLTYSITNSILYIDGIQSAVGSGVTNWPGPGIRSQGFSIGNAPPIGGPAGSTNWAQGRFDNFETFNYVLGPDYATNYYEAHSTPPVGRTNFCQLAPFAVNFPLAQSLTNGQIITTTNNGSGSGNYGWLNWAGGNSGASTLVGYLTNLNSITNYVNPDGSGNNVLYTEGWVFSTTGAKNSLGTYLNLYTNSIGAASNLIGVVLWDGQDANHTEYQVAGFANIALISYQLNNAQNMPSSITFSYQGARACNAYSNQPPICYIVSPTNNQVFTVWNTNSPGTIPITAAASDPEDGLVSVAFYSSTNPTVLGTNIYYQAATNANTNLFTYIWTNAPHGSNYLTAIATDEFGATNMSPRITNIINWPPQVYAGPNIITNWPEGATDTLAGVVTDDGYPKGIITNIQWSVLSSNGPVTFQNPNATNTQVSFTTNGTYVLQLSASDGAVTGTNTCTITIRPRPTISITAPTNSAVLPYGAPITLQATAYDPDGIVTNVQFFYGASLIGNAFELSSNNYAFLWTNPPDAVVSLIAVATDDDGLTNVTAITFTVNQPPQVSAGANQIITIPVTNATLAGVVTDDGLPVGAPVTIIWTVVSSNGPVSFRPNSHATNATASFVYNGVYVLKLTADDSVATNSATVTIIVNQRPQVSVNANPIITLTGSSVLTTLFGGVSDDGLPPGAPVTGVWSVVSATNGTVTFNNSNAFTTTATFTNSGGYVLQLTVNDTVSTNSSQLTEIVNRPPVVNAGTNQTLVWVEGSSNIGTTLTGSFSDDGYPYRTNGFKWTEVSGPSTVSFSPNNTTTNATVTFSTNGIYVLQLLVTDGSSSVSNQCIVTVERRPTVSIISPTNNAAIALGTTITNVASAFGYNSSVTNVLFYDGTNLLGAGTPAIPISGRVGWWRGEGNAYDSAGTNNGSLSTSGASYTNGEVGMGFRFDGTNGYVSVPDATVLKPPNVTVEAWVWLDPSHPANLGGEQIVFKKNTWSAWFEGYSLLKDTINSNGTNSDHFQFCVSRDGDQVAINSQTIVQRGVWYHVGATYDGNQSVLYVNGLAEVSATPGFALDYDTTPLYIGTTGTWPPYLGMFDGILDEVSIYDRALAPSDIASTHNAGTNNPFSFVWTNAPLGSNSLTAVAIDSDGLSTTSKPVVVDIINSGLSVQIVSPINKVFLARSNIFVDAVATSSIPGITISNVQFFVGTNATTTQEFEVIVQPTNGLYQATWRPFVGGQYVLTALATDSRGSNAWSAPVTNTVIALPSIFITTPTNKQVFFAYQTNITVSAYATADSSTSITNVTFYQGTNYLPASIIGVSTSGAGNNTILWNSVTDGVYEVSAKAVDGNGDVGFSLPITIAVVTNQPPNVYAGPDQTVNLSTTPVQLAGIVTDDGFPSNYLVSTWSQVSGPGTAVFSDIHNPRSTVTLTNLGTNVLQLRASDGQYTVSNTVTITVQCYVSPVVDAGSNQLLILPALENTNLIPTIKLVPIAQQPFSDPKGIDYFIPSNCVLVTDGGVSWGETNFFLVFSDGNQSPFISIAPDNQEIYLATVRDTLGHFDVGDVFCGNGNTAGVIMRIKPDGGTEGTNVYTSADTGLVESNAWAVLSNSTVGLETGTLRGGVWVDRSGAWGGDLVVSTTSGDVWRVNASAQPTLVAHLSNGDYYEGITTIPANVQQYGPWAGRILVGGDGDNIWAIDTNGVVVVYNFGFGTEDLRVIPENENFYGVGDGNQRVTGAAASEFRGMAGDILVASEDGNGTLHRIHWNGTSFETYQIGAASQIGFGAWEQVNFAPAGIGNLAPIDYVQLHGCISDYCSTSSVAWVQESGPPGVTFDNSTLTNTLARFSGPGTNYLRLIANDGQFVVYRDTRVDVIRNQAPQVNAGTNQVVPTTSAVLSGLVTDDPWPSNSLTLTWSGIASPPGGQPYFGWTSEVVHLTNVVVTNTVSFTVPGQYVLRLTADDGQASSSAEVVITTASTNLVLTPAYGWPTRTNMPYTVTANVVDQNDHPISGVNIDFQVGGANSAASDSPIATDTNGNASFTYYGTNPGRDLIIAVIDGQSIGGTVIKDWGDDISCGASTYPTYSQCLSLDWPTTDTNYSDFYLFTTTAGSVFTLNYINYNDTALVLRDPSSNVVGVSLDGSLTYTALTNGDYLIEMTDFTPSEIPIYQLALSCGTNQSLLTAPQLQVLLNGTNVPNGGTIVFPTVTIGSQTNLSLIVSNSGSEQLSIYSSAISGDFALSNDISSSQISVGGFTNVGVIFQASSNETSVGELVLQHDAIDQYGFSYTDTYLIYLVASAFPPGEPPSIQLTSPATNDTFFAPATIPIVGAVTLGSAAVSYVYFEQLTTNGPVVIGIASNAVNGSYSFNWQNVPAGNYTVTGVAVDANGRSAAASPVTVQVAPSNGNLPPVAVNDVVDVPAQCQNFVIDVLANDSDPDGDPLQIVALSTNHLAGASASIINNGTEISYSAPPGVPAGWDLFSYEISDGRGGLATAIVEVGIYPPAAPTVVIVAPVSSQSSYPHYTTNADAIVPITASVTPSEAIVKVDFFLGESLIGEVTNGTGGLYTLTNWAATYSACGCGINAQAVDAFGQVGSSQPIFVDVTNNDVQQNSGNLFASIDSIVGSDGTNPVADSMVIRDGIFNLYGKAFYAIPGTNVSWQLGVYGLDGTPIRLLTPPPKDANGGCTVPVGSVPVNGSSGSGLLVSNCDLTTIPNGIYNLILGVDGGLVHNEFTIRFRLESDFKLGQFGFSQSDLTIPVNGIPLTVVRSYNSLNLDKGSFGYGWSYTLVDMNITIDETRGDMEGDDDIFNARTGGGRDVTLTVPNGQRTTFYYDPNIDSETEYPHWDVPPGLLSVRSFDPLPNSAPYAYFGMWQDYGETGTSVPDDVYDFPGWILTMTDGTQYVIKRADLEDHTFGEGIEDYEVHAWGTPYLAEIDQPSLDKIIITPSEIYHLDPQGNKTRVILFQMNSQGLITSITDPNGQTSGGPPAVMYEYDYNQNLIHVEKLLDQTTGVYSTNSFDYTNANFPHFITGIFNAFGVPVARQLYDDNGRIIGIIDAAGKTNSVSYDLNANTQTNYDQLGNPTINSFDSRGNVTNSIDPLGRQTSSTFDDNGNLTSITDPLQHTTYYSYDGNGNKTSVVDALGHTNSMGYDSSGNLTATTNALDKVTQMQYDANGNETNVTDALNNNYGVVYNANSQPSAVTDPTGQTNAVANYDSMGNVSSMMESASGVTTSFAYDPNGNPTTSSNVWVNPTNAADVRMVAEQSVYDGQNRLTTSTDPNGLQSSVAYDANGRQSQTVDEYNQTSGWVYDASGKLIQISYPDGSVTRMTYDDAGRLSVSDTKHQPGTISNGRRNIYDTAGQLVEQDQLTNVAIEIANDAYGVPSSSATSVGTVIATSTYGYDLAGRRMAATNGFGAVTLYKYDAVGQETALIDAMSNRTDYAYDPVGRLIATTNALHQVTQYVYDDLGRLVSTIYPDGSVTGTTYDTVGNRLAETNQLGLVTMYQYDADNRLTNLIKPMVFNPEGGTNANPQWRFAYDTYGLLKSVTDPKQRTTQFAYDQLGRLVTHTLPMAEIANLEYDSYGRLFHKIDFKGQTNEFVYDSIGQVITNQQYAPGVSTPNVAASYIYDNENRIQQVIEPRGTNTFTYDTAGHVLSMVTPEGVLNYEYEPIGGRRVRTYTVNSDIRYNYDLLGRISTVTVMMRDGVPLSIAEVTTNDYTALGSLQDTYFANGVHALYQYNIMNRLTNLTYNASGGTLLAQYSYVSNTNGQWKAATEILRQTNASYATNHLAWGYDNLGRVTNETCGSLVMALNYTNNYGYDLAGNRLWLTNVSGGITTLVGYAYNNNNQLTQEVTTVNGITGNLFVDGYDANGSLTNRNSATEQNAYGYDLRNRLATAVVTRTDGGHQLSETINFTYDYQGNRVRAQWSRSMDGGGALNGTNLFLNEPYSPAGVAQVLEELPAVGAKPSASYTLGGRIISQGRGGIVSHLLPDGHGSTRQLADGTGSITARYSYDAYGTGLDFTNGTQTPTATSILYSGEQLDPDLQLYNLRARFYDPIIGRFNQIDPFALNQQGGVNLYSYAAGDPVNNVDPRGLYEVDVHRYLTEFLAYMAGYQADAEYIGKQTQALDDPGSTRDAILWGFLPNLPNMRDYHFVNLDRFNQLLGRVDFSNPSAGGGTYMGEFFHAYEDTYAHSPNMMGIFDGYYGDIRICGHLIKGNGGIFGHAFHGHEPDHTWKHPEKAMRMAQDIFNMFKANAPAGSPSKNWSDIEQCVHDFVYYQPDFYFQDGIIPNATFEGYDTKIQKLNMPGGPSLSLDPMYGKVFKHESDVQWYKGGTIIRPPHRQIKGAELLMFNVDPVVATW